jgi:arsenate reductase
MNDQPERVFNVLFLCTGNSARSILAESALNKHNDGRFRAFSAGSQPKGPVNPDALRLLARIGYPIEGLRSKGWEEFAVPGAAVMDFVVTVCDDAAGEACPAWPGQPITAHWGIEDPSLVQGGEIDRERAFVTALRYLENRLRLFMCLPLGNLEAAALRTKVREIGQSQGASSPRDQAA